MNKYIRTEKTIFEVVEETDIVYRVRAKKTNSKIYSKSKCQTEIVAKADNIVELYDKWIFDTNEEKNAIRDIGYYSLTLMKNSLLDNKNKNIRLAIWTDKGLQFVARMNSEGELELL